MHLYQEFPPHPALATHVACFWTSQALPAGGPVRHRILPDNSIDILWQDRAPLGFVAGMMSRAHRVETAQPTQTVAVRLVDDAGGTVRIDDLAHTLGVSRQHLALQFRKRVGLAPKTFAMVSRFRRASAVLRRHAGAQVDWAQLALDCGYYDQSHLIHALRLFADETPDRFARPRG